MVATRIPTRTELSDSIQSLIEAEADDLRAAIADCYARVLTERRVAVGIGSIMGGKLSADGLFGAIMLFQDVLKQNGNTWNPTGNL